MYQEKQGRTGHEPSRRPPGRLGNPPSRATRLYGTDGRGPRVRCVPAPGGFAFVADELVAQKSG
jgi:hypothetical protein